MVECIPRAVAIFNNVNDTFYFNKNQPIHKYIVNKNIVW